MALYLSLLFDAPMQVGVYGGGQPSSFSLAHCAVDEADHGNDEWMQGSSWPVFIPENRGKVRAEKEAVTDKVGPRSAR